MKTYEFHLWHDLEADHSAFDRSKSLDRLDTSLDGLRASRMLEDGGKDEVSEDTRVGLGTRKTREEERELSREVRAFDNVGCETKKRIDQNGWIKDQLL